VSDLLAARLSNDSYAAFSITQVRKASLIASQPSPTLRVSYRQGNKSR
jgi:hypothetical protein